MDIAAKVEEIVKKLKADPKILEKFRKEPIKAVESLLGVDLPDDQIKAIVEMVKTKIDLDKAGDLLSSLTGMLK